MEAHLLQSVEGSYTDKLRYIPKTAYSIGTTSCKIPEILYSIKSKEIQQGSTIMFKFHSLSLWIKLDADAVGRMGIDSVKWLQLRPAIIGQ